MTQTLQQKLPSATRGNVSRAFSAKGLHSGLSKLGATGLTNARGGFCSVRRRFLKCSEMIVTKVLK